MPQETCFPDGCEFEKLLIHATICGTIPHLFVLRFFYYLRSSTFLMSTNEAARAYRVLLDGEEIGTTALERADAPMGVVFGILRLHNITEPYLFFKSYCSEHGVQVGADDAEDKFISTYNIPGMQVLAPDGTAVKGISTYVSGTEDAFEIYISGIAYPFYEEQFPQHVAAYKNQ